MTATITEPDVDQQADVAEVRVCQVKSCSAAATWRVIGTCGHAGELCDGCRRRVLNLWLDAKLDGCHFLHCQRPGCGRVMRAEQIVWERL